MKRLRSILAGFLVLGLLCSSGWAESIVIFSFEDGLQQWEIPDWEKVDEYYSIEGIAVAEEASDGERSLEIKVNFSGDGWKGAYVERMMNVKDWSAFGSLSCDIYLPYDAPEGLNGRIILTVGEDWKWTETNRAVELAPGEWTRIRVNLKQGSMDWEFFPTEVFRTDVRKLGVRIESNHGPAYAGKVYVDNIQLIE